MGLLRSLRPGIDLSASLPAGAVAGPPLDLASPWVPRPTHLAHVAFADLFGIDAAARLPMDRAEAMAVPAVARARHIIAGTVARIPLRPYRGEGEIPAAEVPWIDSTSSALPPYHRLLWTADDLLFHGWSCWSRTNGADSYPIRMDRIPMGRWSLDENGRVKVDRGDGVHELVPANRVCLIPGAHEGLLAFAQRTIRHAADLQAAAAKAAQTPAAHLVLKQTPGSTPLDEDAIGELLDSWAAARAGKHGGVGYVSAGLEVEELGTFSEHLLETGRNAAAVDIARAASLPADLLDAAGEQSMTYANSRDNDARAIQYGVGLYLSAISAALSQDGITPRGQSVRFDLESWLESPVPPAAPATPAQTAQTATPPQEPAE